MAAPKKKATKKATKKAGPKRKSSTSPANRATQLQVAAQAHEYFSKHPDFKGQLEPMDHLDNTVPGYISTQSLAIDWVIGNGGYAQSRVILISGDEGTGKSTVGDHAMSEVQRIGGHAVLWDPENARDNRYQKRIGIVRKRAHQMTSQTMEDGFDLMIAMLEWYSVHDPERPGIILWDTPAASPTRNEADPEKTDERMGPAKIIRSYLRKLNQHLLKTRWILFVVNQTYRGTSQGGQSYKAVFGGGGLPFYSSTTLDIGHVKAGRIYEPGAKERGLPPLGQVVYVKNSKSRVFPPWRNRTLFIEYGQGIDNTFTIFETLAGYGAIDTSKKGWAAVDPGCIPELGKAITKKWQGGFRGLRQFAREDPKLWPLLLEVYKGIEL